MTPPNDSVFKRDYQAHLKHLKLKGLQPKTIDAYARAIRRIGAYFLATQKNGPTYAHKSRPLVCAPFST